MQGSRGFVPSFIKATSEVRTATSNAADDIGSNLKDDSVELI